MSRFPSWFVVVALMMLGGLRQPAGQPADHADRPAHRLPLRDAPGREQEQQGESGHPRVFGRRHARGRVLLRRPRVPAAHRGRGAERRQGSPARFHRCHHRRFGRQLHGAGLRPVRRQAVRRLRAALPEAQRAGRDHRPRLQPALLGRPVVGGLGPVRAGVAAVRRNPVQRRHVRRSQSRQGADDPGVGHRHLDRLALRLQPGHVRHHLLGSQCGAAVARRRGIVGGAGRALVRSRVKNYGGTCNCESRPRGRSCSSTPTTRRDPPRARYDRSRTCRPIGDSARRPYLHLVDGGVSDNVGMRGVLDALEVLEALHEAGLPTPLDNARRIIVFVVNSLSSPPTNWDESYTHRARSTSC